MVYYFVCFVVSWLLTAIYFYKWKSTYSVFITLSFIAVDVMNFGAWQLSVAENTREAIMAQYVMYSGGSFATMLVMFSIFDICKLRIKKIYRFAIFMFGLLIFASSLTIGHSQIFYKSVMLSKYGGATVLIKEYGPMHTVYYISLGIDFLVAIIALVYSLRKKKEISKKNAFLLLFCFFICIVSFAAGRILGTVDIINAAFNLVLLTYIFVSDRFVLYDVDATAVQTLQKSNYVGIISFDLHQCFLGCNSAAKEYFPELGFLKVDRVTTEPEFLEWIREMEKNHELKKTISRKERFYSLEGQYLMDGKKVRGIQFILLDCTDEKEYQKYLKKVAITDAMTHLLNRRAFEDEVKEISGHELPGDFVIISLDLNGLKKVNDTIGHFAGDELICAAAEKITDSFSSIGTVFRIGGDEFEVIARCSRDELNESLMKFQQKCEEWKGTCSHELSISKGYAFHNENSYMDVFELIREADRQMYSDKSEYYRLSGNDRRRRTEG